MITTTRATSSFQVQPILEYTNHSLALPNTVSSKTSQQNLLSETMKALNYSMKIHQEAGHTSTQKTKLKTRIGSMQDGTILTMPNQATEVTMMTNWVWGCRVV